MCFIRFLRDVADGITIEITSRVTGETLNIEKP